MWFSDRLSARYSVLMKAQYQGVITYASPIETFATRIKLWKTFLGGSWSRDQDNSEWLISTEQHTDTKEALLHLCPLNPRKIKWSRWFSPIKILDLSCKHFYGRYVSKYYLQHSLPGLGMFPWNVVGDWHSLSRLWIFWSQLCHSGNFRVLLDIPLAAWLVSNTYSMLSSIPCFSWDSYIIANAYWISVNGR